MTLANANVDTTALRAIGERVPEYCEHQKHLIDALLTLARSQPSLEAREPLDRAPIAAHALTAIDTARQTVE